MMENDLTVDAIRWNYVDPGPGANSTVPTTIKIGEEAVRGLEYLEDPFGFQKPNLNAQSAPINLDQLKTSAQSCMEIFKEVGPQLPEHLRIKDLPTP